MTKEEKIAYNEVLEILEKLNLIENLPKEIVDEMRKSKEENYNYIYDKDEPLEKQKISKKGMILLSTIYLAYICDDDNEKKKLKAIYDENEKEIKEKNKISKLFQNELTVETKEENISSLIVNKKESILKKILSFLKNIFK